MQIVLLRVLRPVAFCAALAIPKETDELQRALRGSMMLSHDGQTYLSVVESECDPSKLMLDGKLWGHPLGVAAKVAPGDHDINCANGGGVRFVVPKGTIFRFDYWGP